jgi:GAF domain-containing protein
LACYRESLTLEKYGASGNYLSPVEQCTLTLDGSGLIPQAIREMRVINVGDVVADKKYLQSWEDAVSELVIPLIVEGEVIGVIDLQSATPFAFDGDDERLMNLFALRAALMIAHAQLVEKTEERNRRLGTLHAIESSISSSLDLQISLNSVVEQVSLD